MDLLLDLGLRFILEVCDLDVLALKQVVDQRQAAERQRPRANDHRNDLGIEVPVRRLKQHDTDQADHERREDLHAGEVRLVHFRQHSLDATVGPHILDERPEQTEHGDGEQNDHHRALHPTDPVTLDRDEHVALEDAAENEAQHHRWTRPLEVLHAPRQDSEEQQRVEIAPLTLAFEGADVHQAQHNRQNQRIPKRRDFGELTAEDVAKTRSEDVGDRDRPHHRIGNGQVLGQHVRSGDQTMDQERAENDRHAGRTRHAEHDGRHQCATFT